MFKKRIVILLILTACVTLLSACGEKAADTNVGSNQNSNNTGFDRPNSPREFGQNTPDLYGEVKTVSGDKITVALLEMPERRQMTEEERQQMRERMQDNTNGQGNAANSQGGTAPNDRPRAGAGRGFGGEKKYTGKSETLTVPSGTTISSFQRGNENFEEKKLSLSDIKQGTLIQVWYKKDTGDKKEIESIRVMANQPQN
ncbi:MAG: hypothetical protein N3B21_02445 [Clostridia bacterium]|nr:hypothetical protein [Clostridia bacterium]